MTGLFRNLPFVAALVIVCGLVLVAGCGEDDPVTPTSQPEAGYLAVSPDSLMTLWQTALTTMDSTMYSDVLGPEFQFHFRPRDVSTFELLTEYMTRDETVRIGWDMFSGEDVTNWQGNIIPAVSRISMPFMTQQTPWEYVAAGSANATASARFMLQMFVERGFGYPILAATGLFDFFAIVDDTVDADGATVDFYRLISMIETDPEVKSSEVDSWGGVHLTYLVNEAPEAALLVTDIGGTPFPLYQCDASGSRDTDSGLHPEAYRWQFESGGMWSDWVDTADTNSGYQVAGPKTITVEVRDRWGSRATASQEVTVPAPELPFPSSPDILMSNFLTIYELRDFGGYRQLMHPDFLTILQDATTTEFPDVGTTLDVGEELRIHERMFSGEHVTDPNGDLVPGVQGIYFSTFRALDSWVQSPPDDIIPNAEWAPFEVDIMLDRGQSFSTLKTQGTIKFYVTSRDSLHDGFVRPYYQMAAQVDLTNLGKGSESISWGSIKALFR